MSCWPFCCFVEREPVTIEWATFIAELASNPVLVAVTLLNTPFTVWDAMGFAAVFAMLAVLSAGGKKYAERLEV